MKRAIRGLVVVLVLVGAVIAPSLWDTWRVWSEVATLREAATAAGYEVVAEAWAVGNLDGNIGCRGEVLLGVRGTPANLERATQFCTTPDVDGRARLCRAHPSRDERVGRGLRLRR